MNIEEPSNFPGSPVTSRTEEFEFEKNEVYKNIDIGAVAGIGIAVPLSKGIWGATSSFVLNARYQRGFIDVYDAEPQAFFNEVEQIIGLDENEEAPKDLENNIKHSGVSIRFGLIFAI